MSHEIAYASIVLQLRASAGEHRELSRHVPPDVAEITQRTAELDEQAAARLETYITEH